MLQYNVLLTSRWMNVSQLPTTTLQQTVIAVTIALTVLAAFVYSLRLCGRIITKQVGLGKSKPRISQHVLLEAWLGCYSRVLNRNTDDYLITLATVSHLLHIPDRHRCIHTFVSN